MQRAVAIDLGGTKIECAVVHFEDGAVSASTRSRVATERQKGYSHILDQVERLVAEVCEQESLSPARIGLSMPGSIDPASQLVANSNTTALNGRTLALDLSERLGAEIVAQNDANCFALAEARYGAGQGARVVFGVIMGTGVGGGLVVDGEVWPGAQGIAGEWGHSTLAYEGLPCWCGRAGCVEQYLSGPAVEEAYRALSGQAKPLEEIVADAVCDPRAKQTLDRLHRWFGVAIGNVVNLLDPDVVVLGGGLSKIESLYEQGREAALGQVFHPAARLDLRAPSLGDSAGVFGAATLVI